MSRGDGVIPLLFVKSFLRLIWILTYGFVPEYAPSAFNIQKGCGLTHTLELITGRKEDISNVRSTCLPYLFSCVHMNPAGGFPLRKNF